MRTTPALLALLLLAACTLPARAQDESSTGEELVPAGDSSTADGVVVGSDSSTGGGSLDGSSGLGGTNSSTAGAEPAKVYEEFKDYYVCGYREAGTGQGYYLNGKRWETNEGDYFRCPVINQSLSCQEKPYPQCTGWSKDSSCLTQFKEGVDLPFNSALKNLENLPNDKRRLLTDHYKRGLFCSTTDANARFVRGEQSSQPVCIVIGGGTRLWKMHFYPKIDQFAVLTVQDSFAYRNESLSIPVELRDSTYVPDWLAHRGTAFQVEFNGVRSESKRRYGEILSGLCTGDGGTLDNCTTIAGPVCTVVPFHTVIIKMTRGVVDEISFDNDCSLCSNDLCIDGNCAQEIQKCTSSGTYDATNTAALTDCDFKVYVSWSGTDADGTYLASSGRRLSQFRRWSLGAVYNQATDFDTGSIDLVPKAEDQL